MYYFTSDLHFNHKNIINTCSRPFKDIDEMNEEIIKKWNKVVHKNDIVYILGDITMHGKIEVVKEFMDRLKGRKILIKGNHDNSSLSKLVNEGIFEEMLDYQVLKYNKQSFVLFHYPIMDFDGMYGSKPSIHLHGHIHSTNQYNLNNRKHHIYRYDVGIDANDFTPVSIDRIIEFFK